jgi:hypothetical protein
MPEQIKKIYVNDKELSEMTGLSVKTFRNWRHIGKGPAYVKLKRSVLYKLDDVDSYFDNRRIEPSKFD